MQKSLLLLAAFAFIGLAGCSSDDDTVVEGTDVDTTIAVDPAPMPAPMPTDTMMVVDTTMAPAPAEGAATTPADSTGM